MNKKILTRDEVMKQLRIGKSLFYKLISIGELECYKEGNRIKVPADSVDAYITKKMGRA